MNNIRLLARKLRKTAVACIYRPPFGLRSSGKNVIVRRPHDFFGRNRISLGDDVTILSGAHVRALGEYAGEVVNGYVHIGDRVYIGRNFFIGGAAAGIEIGDDCVISENVSIFDNSHGFEPDCGSYINNRLTGLRAVTIGAGTFIGINSVVLAGVKLGKYCVVGANTVVTKSFADYCMVAGSPAKIVKKYNHSKKTWDKI